MSATAAPPVGGDFGDYRIDSLLGRGAMGVVYRAWQRRMNRPVALKVLPPDLAQDPMYRARFAREADALARLDSPHVIQIYDHGELDGNLYLAMQLVSGPDLGRVLDDGVLPPRRALRIVEQVAAALGDGHAIGVVHRDVKPSNILLRPRAAHADPDDEDFVYLCDFGIARSAADIASGPETQGIIGTLGYLAPERLRGEPATPASDIYSLGCLLWALLAGSAPYQGSQPDVIMSHLGAPLPQLQGDDRRTAMVNALLRGTMAKDPTQRPSIAEVRRQIRDILAVPGRMGAPVALRPTLPEVPAPRSRRLLLAGGAAVLVVLAVLAWVLLLDPVRTASDRLRQATPVGVTCTETAVSAAGSAAGALAQAVCDAGPDVGELRLAALSGSPDRYLRDVARQDPDALQEGTCPEGLPAKAAWSEGEHGGTLLCNALGPNTRYAWTFDDLDVVAVLDGLPEKPFPQDVEAVAAWFEAARYP